MTNQNNAAQPEPYLAPCPFCGSDLHAQWGRKNPKARCRTDRCKGSQLPVLNLDVPDDIAAWNTRALQDNRATGHAESLNAIGVIGAIEKISAHWMDGYKNGCSYYEGGIDALDDAERAIRALIQSQAVKGGDLPNFEISKFSESNDAADIVLPGEDEAVAHMYPNCLNLLKKCEPSRKAWSTKVWNLLRQSTVPLFTSEQIRSAVLADRRNRSMQSWPENPTGIMLDALRTGSRKDWPSDELCRVRYAALRAAVMAAQQTEQKQGVIDE